jgi:hypothetical protein
MRIPAGLRATAASLSPVACDRGAAWWVVSMPRTIATVPDKADSSQMPLIGPDFGLSRLGRRVVMPLVRLDEAVDPGFEVAFADPELPAEAADGEAEFSCAGVQPGPGLVGSFRDLVEGQERIRRWGDARSGADHGYSVMSGHYSCLAVPSTRCGEP